MRHLAIIGLAILFSCNNNNTTDHDPDIVTPHVGIDAPATINYNILSQFPHDTGAYTQGLEIYNGKLYEGTGDFSNSSLRITNWKTGAVEKKHVMGTNKIFGEGITIFKNKIYQLTWESNKAYQYDINNIETPEKTFDWPYEGWGLTHDTSSLIISDGSSNIYFVDPETFKVKSTVAIKDDQGPVNYLNELEYVNGMIYANVYQTNLIVKIDAESGHVVGRLYMNGLLQQSDIIPERTDVLNGIAYDSTTKNFLITGKRWPKMFEVKVAP
jgi:glutamine cyclotransferase